MLNENSFHKETRKRMLLNDKLCNTEKTAKMEKVQGDFRALGCVILRALGCVILRGSGLCDSLDRKSVV